MDKFDYEKFMMLSGKDLYEYTTPYLTAPAEYIPLNVVREMRSKFGDYIDAYKVIFAMELGSKWMPDEYVDVIPKYLSHSDASVRLAACRFFHKMPKKLITTQLIHDIRRNLPSTPEGKELLQSLDWLSE